MEQIYDELSIEAAYLNGDWPPSTSRSQWKTGRRSSRSVVSLPEENEMEVDGVIGLMRLAKRKERLEELEGRKSCEQEQKIHTNAGSTKSASLPAENEMEMEGVIGLMRLAKRKERLEELEGRKSCDQEQKINTNTGSTKSASPVNSYKSRVFKSLQALGGQGPTRIKIIGRFAKSNVSNHGKQEQMSEGFSKFIGRLARPNEQETMSQELSKIIGRFARPNEQQRISENFSRLDEQLPLDVLDKGHEKKRQFSSLSKEANTEVLHGNGTQRTGGHVCTICSCVFNSGQALGGHKGSHAKTSSKGKRQPAADSQHRGRRVQGEVRPVDCTFLPRLIGDDDTKRGNLNGKYLICS